MSQKAAVSKKKVRTPKKETKFVLKNGLEVRLISSSRAPVLSVQMWVKTGSADERKQEEGISHFIEHLLFKGTKKYAVGEIARTVEASGGEMNAWTSFDQTVFYVNISKEFESVGLDIIAEMMGSPLFDPKEIDAEREVVLEEIKRTNDSPARKGSRLLFSSLYKKHPYRLPVIGRPEVVKNVSPKMIRRYFKERYTARNMLLVIAGDFEIEAMKAKVKERYSALPGARLRAIKRPKEPSPHIAKGSKARPKIFFETADVKELQLNFSWPLPAVKHPDIPAIETFAMILGQGDASRLVKALRVQSDVVTSVGAGCFTSRDPGFFSISAQMNPMRLEQALTGLIEQTVSMLTEPPTPLEIDRAIVNTESSELYGLETVDGLARKIGSLTTLLGDPSAFEKHLAAVRKFNAKKSLEVAKKYLDPKKMSIVCLAPSEGVDAKAEKEIRSALEKAAIDFHTAWTSAKPGKGRVTRARAVGKTWKPQADRDLGIQKRTLKNGLRVFARLATSTPVVSARLGFLGGSRLEPASKDGLTELLSRTWITGIDGLSETELNSKIEGIAAGLGAFGGRHTSGVSGQVLTGYEKELIPIFTEAAFNPVISDEAVEREKLMMIESLRTRDDRPSQVASRIFMETLFAGHPYSRDPMGTKESIQSLSSSDLNRLHRESLRAGDAVFALTGNADLDRWCSALEKIEFPKDLKGPGFSKVRLEKNISKEQKLFRELKKEQSHILVGWRGLTLDDPRRYALQVAQAILAGQGGRLFIELRDKKSLAYSVGPMTMEGVDGGYFGAFIGCTPEKGALAIEMMKAEISKLATTSVPEVELARAIRFLIGSHDLGLQRTSAVSSSILFNEIYGLPSEEIFHYADRVRAVTAEQIRSLIAEIVGGPSVTVAVGPKAPW